MPILPGPEGGISSRVDCTLFPLSAIIIRDEVGFNLNMQFRILYFVLCSLQLVMKFAHCRAFSINKLI